MLKNPSPSVPPIEPAKARPWLARLHPGLFSIPLGILGLSGAGARVVPIGVTVGNPLSLALVAIGISLLAILSLLWILKIVRHTEVARQELQHPVQGALLSLAPLAYLILVALLAPALPELHVIWWTVTLGALSMAVCMAWLVVARLSTGQMPAELITPALYLPTVSGGLVGAMALKVLGQPGWAAVLLGMGIGGWALLEIRILHRLFSGPLPMALRPTIGLEMAPTSVCTLAITVLWPSLPVEVVLICIGIASAPVMAILTRWPNWKAVPFNAGFWSFSFPLAALSSSVVFAVNQGNWPVGVALAALWICSAVIGYLSVRTIILLFKGTLLPPQ